MRAEAAEEIAFETEGTCMHLRTRRRILDWGTAPAKLVTADLKMPETAKNQRREMITPSGKSKNRSFRPCWKKLEKGLWLKFVHSKISKDLTCSAHISQVPLLDPAENFSLQT